MRQSVAALARLARVAVVVLSPLVSAACVDAPSGPQYYDVPLALSIVLAHDTIGRGETVGATIVARNVSEGRVGVPGLSRCPLGIQTTAGPDGSRVQLEYAEPEAGPAACVGTADLSLAVGDSIVAHVILHPIIVVGGDAVVPTVGGRYTIVPVLYGPDVLLHATNKADVTIVVR